MYYNFYDPESLDELTTDEMIDVIVSIFGHESDEAIKFCRVCECCNSATIRFTFRYFINKE